MSEHDQIAELLGAYSLDAVDVAERDEIELHLAECPRCRAEVAEHREVAAILSQTTTPAPAPDGVWARIAADLEPPAPPMRITLAPGRSEEAAAAPAGAEADVVPITAARSRRSKLAVALVGVAACLVLLVGGIIAVRSQDPGPQTLDELAADASTHSKLSVDLAGDGVTAKAVVQPDGSGYLILDGVPAPAEGDVYQLWGKVDEEVLSLGTFGETTVVPFSVDPNHIGDIELFAVTEERAPGVPVSEQEPMMAGTV